jgi:hypothetical protein
MVLRPQPGLFPIGADFGHAEWATGQERERERRPEDLSAPLAPRAVEHDLAATIIA